MAQSMNQENTLPSIDEVGLEDFTLRGRIIAMVIRFLTLVLIITSLFLFDRRSVCCCVIICACCTL